MNTTTNTKIDNKTSLGILYTGYDIDLVGLKSGHFDQLHITALCCISISCMSAIGVLYMSFNEKKHKALGFFHWRQISRFVVYMAFCDCFFNLFHSMDHLHVFVTRDHPRPKILCGFYTFLLVEFVGAQVLMVNLVAVNMFVLIFFNKRMNFGKFDWKLLTWMFGYPFVANIVAVCTSSLGPNGSFCFFDGVNGNILQLAIITIPQGAIVIINTALYSLTWFKIRQQQPQLKSQRGYERRVTKRAHRAAKNMILLVLAFLVQWCPPSVFGLWSALGFTVPLPLLQCAIVSSNIGGVLNGFIFVILSVNQKNYRSTYRSSVFSNRTVVVKSTSKSFDSMSSSTGVDVAPVGSTALSDTLHADD